MKLILESSIFSNYVIKISIIFILCFLIIITCLIIKEWKKLTVELKDQEEFNKNISHDIYVIRSELSNINDELNRLDNTIEYLRNNHE